MQVYLYGLFLVVISLQTVFAEGNIVTSDTIIPPPVLRQPSENLSPGSPYNINNPERDAGIKHDLNYHGFNGILRAGYIQTQEKTVNNQQAYGFGGELAIGFSLGSYFKLHTSAFAAINPGLNSGNKNEVQGDFFDANKNSYLTLGEAVISLYYADFEAHLGPQRFNSPHMDQDDLRLLPNIFEAYLVDYHLDDEIYLGMGFIRTAKGWENNVNAADFIGIGQAFGGTGSESWLAWGKYNQGYISTNVWYYYIKDVQQIVYTDFSYSRNINPIWSYSVGAQFDLGRSVGQQSIGLVDANTLGIFASLSAYGLTFSSAYNKNFGASAAINSVGGGPFFTSMEVMTLDAVDQGKNAQAVILNLDYQPQILQPLTIGIAAGDFQADKAADFHIQELNAYLNYQYKQMFTVNIMYAYVKNLKSAIDTNQLRVILSYQF